MPRIRRRTPHSNTPTPSPVDSSGSGGTGEHSPCGGSAAADPRATGGNVSTVGNYTIHTFTSNGTFTVSDATLTELDVLVVGGGGGGGRSVGGGGGGGAVLTARIERQPLPNEEFTVVVGGGGGGSIEGGAPPASEGARAVFAGRADLGGTGARRYDGRSGRRSKRGVARDTGPSSATASTSAGIHSSAGDARGAVSCFLTTPPRTARTCARATATTQGCALASRGASGTRGPRSATPLSALPRATRAQPAEILTTPPRTARTCARATATTQGCALASRGASGTRGPRSATPLSAPSPVRLGRNRRRFVRELRERLRCLQRQPSELRYYHRVRI